MATAAQIEANRLNEQMYTYPKTKSGKARASLNSLKHGERAKVAAPVLPQEDPRELDEIHREMTKQFACFGRIVGERTERHTDGQLCRTHYQPTNQPTKPTHQPTNQPTNHNEH